MYPMSRFRLNLTPEFERDLAEFMQQRNIASKAEAIRTAVRECLQAREIKPADFKKALGSVKQTVKNPRFKTDDDLW